MVILHKTMAPRRGAELPRAFPNSRISSFKHYGTGKKKLQITQNRRGVGWMQQLGATNEGRDVTHVARRMTIEHRDEHLDVKVKQSLQGLDRS
jgi:hypothetical protein